MSPRKQAYVSSYNATNHDAGSFNYTITSSKYGCAMLGTLILAERCPIVSEKLDSCMDSSYAHLALLNDSAQIVYTD
jgi:hypothetical protein